ncbi:hypothetical protein Salat_2601700 [Sesamum alatum]|uniref:Uncharacterized protein n=1 Tax=Sesamum alatum TaxID=300844 RepID=A0AAE2CAF5_9LAMI|nr:hypothetical protein Salat_2601700 [Sesamum alatum]
MSAFSLVSSPFPTPSQSPPGFPPPPFQLCPSSPLHQMDANPNTRSGPTDPASTNSGSSALPSYKLGIFEESGHFLMAPLRNILLGALTPYFQFHPSLRLYLTGRSSITNGLTLCQ